MMQKSKYFILKKALFTYFPQKSKYFILKKALFFFKGRKGSKKRERREKEKEMGKEGEIYFCLKRIDMYFINFLIYM